MAFAATSLAAMGYANGRTNWFYRTTDTMATVMADAYFDTVASMLRAGDRISIEASDGYWDDVVWAVVQTIGSEDVAIGVQADTVDDSLDGNSYRLGLRRERWDGSVWQRLEADGTIAASDAVIVHADQGAAAITTTLAADSAGVGKQVAVAPPTPSQSIAVGDFFWGCVFAPANAGVPVNVLTSANAGRLLNTTATAGNLDDTLLIATTVPGINITTDEPGSGAAAIAANINYPLVGDITQT